MENKLVFLQCYIVKYCCWFHWRMLKSHWRVVLSKADAQKASPKVLLSKDQRVEATQRTSPHCWDSATGFYRELLIKGLKTETYKIVLHNPLYSNRVDCRDKHSLAGNGVFLKQSHWPCNVVVYGQLCAVMVGSPSVLLWLAHLLCCYGRLTLFIAPPEVHEEPPHKFARHLIECPPLGAYGGVLSTVIPSHLIADPVLRRRPRGEAMIHYWRTKTKTGCASTEKRHLQPGTKTDSSALVCNSGKKKNYPAGWTLRLLLLSKASVEELKSVHPNMAWHIEKVTLIWLLLSCPTHHTLQGLISLKNIMRHLWFLLLHKLRHTHTHTTNTRIDNAGLMWYAHPH